MSADCEAGTDIAQPEHTGRISTRVDQTLHRIDGNTGDPARYFADSNTYPRGALVDGLVQGELIGCTDVNDVRPVTVYRNGPDDYIVNPFAPRELIARVNGALVKAGKQPLIGE